MIMTQFDRDFFHGLLTFKRCHDTESERDFCDKLDGVLTDLGWAPSIDQAGNRFVSIGTSRTLFTCHVDTCHRTSGFQTVVYTTDGKFTTAHGATECLGADDGAGILVLLRMIEAGVPGTYAFYRGEEKGGIGSGYSVESNPEFYKGFDRAVAFDRGGFTDVITWQSHGVCCSDEFADALSAALCDRGMLFMPSDRGVYTDTAEMIHLVPECTNISVGYSKQHGPEEVQVWSHLDELCNAVLGIDWEALPTVREAKPVEDSWLSFTGGSSQRANWRTSVLNDVEQEAYDKAIYDGEDGDLKLLVAALLHPENPEMAARHISFDDLTLGDWDDVESIGLEFLAEICQYVH
jgi:hypothetical protein